jgi:chaperone modulatory protein CbpM
MIRFQAVITVVGGIAEPDLRDWIARGWVSAEPEPSGDFMFDDVDIARVRLIRDLRQVMAVECETVPLVLDLLDQVYALRRTLRTVTAALEGQPDDVRARILAMLGD